MIQSPSLRKNGGLHCENLREPMHINISGISKKHLLEQMQLKRRWTLMESNHQGETVMIHRGSTVVDSVFGESKAPTRVICRSATTSGIQERLREEGLKVRHRNRQKMSTSRLSWMQAFPHIDPITGGFSQSECTNGTGRMDGLTTKLVFSIVIKTSLEVKKKTPTSEKKLFCSERRERTGHGCST